MALINCPECKNKVSEKADVCPKCGYAISRNIENIKKHNKKEAQSSVFGCLFMVVIVVSFFIYYLPSDEEVLESNKIKANKEKVLYSKVKKVSALDYDKNIKLYEELSEINPSKKIIENTLKTPDLETMVLYDQFNIESSYGGRQISKTYFIKESILKVDEGDSDIRQVKTYRKVTDESGSTEYKSTFHVNCDTSQYTFTRHWSTGFGEDRGLFVDGQWSSVSEYAEMKELSDQVCVDKL